MFETEFQDQICRNQNNYSDKPHTTTSSIKKNRFGEERNKACKDKSCEPSNRKNRENILDKKNLLKREKSIPHSSSGIQKVNVNDSKQNKNLVPNKTRTKLVKSHDSKRIISNSKNGENLNYALNKKDIYNRRHIAPKVEVDIGDFNDSSPISKVEERKVAPKTTLDKFKLNWNSKTKNTMNSYNK